MFVFLKKVSANLDYSNIYFNSEACKRKKSLNVECEKEEKHGKDEQIILFYQQMSKLIWE